MYWSSFGLAEHTWASGGAEGAATREGVHTSLFSVVLKDGVESRAVNSTPAVSE